MLPNPLVYGLILRSLVAALVIVAATPFPASAVQEAVQEQEQATVDFEGQIKPLIAQRCLRCHGPEEQEADFRMDDRQVVFYYIEPGDPDGSELHERLISDDPELMMPPPDEGGPLAEEEVVLLRDWISQGANWPEGTTIEPPPPEVEAKAQEEIQQKKQQQDRQESSWQLVWEIAGLLHPLLVHFPVALLIAGAIFGIFGFRGESPMSDAAYYCLWLGALGAVLAAASGWSFAIRESYLNWQSFDFQRSIDIHRWGGVLVAVLAFLLAVIASMSRRRDPYGTGGVWKISLVLLAGLVGFVAHHGGKMTHAGLHDELVDKATIVIENIRGNQPAAPDNNDEAPSDAMPADEKSPDEKSPDEKSPDEKSPDEKSSDEKTSDEDDAKQEGTAKTSDGK